MSLTDLKNLFAGEQTAFPDWIEDEYNTDRLLQFFHFLTDKNESGGFFSKGDAEKIFQRHFYESLVFSHYVAKALPVSRETRLADAGTGPGLPGYLFSCRKDAPEITLIDSSRRRLSLLEEFHSKIDSPVSITFQYSRLEEMKQDYDIVVFRALIPFPFVLDLIAKIIRQNGYAVYFSAASEKDTEDREGRVEKLGFVSRETLVPSEVNIDSTRTVKILQKIKKPQKGYPVPWKKLKEEIQICRM